MLKTLKKQSKRKILLNNKIKEFVKKQLWQHAIVVGTAVFYAWLFDKWWQAGMFAISHTIIRPRFDRQYHCGTTCQCLIVTLSILLLATYFILPLELSLLSTLPITYFVCWVGYLAQCKVDADKYLKKSVEQMTDDEFADFCKSRHLSEEYIAYAKLILREKLKGEALYSAMGYSVAQSKRIRKKIIELLKDDTIVIL